MSRRRTPASAATSRPAAPLVAVSPEPPVPAERACGCVPAIRYADALDRQRSGSVREARALADRLTPRRST
jgi:hypothetical protein